MLIHQTFRLDQESKSDVNLDEMVGIVIVNACTWMELLL